MLIERKDLESVLEIFPGGKKIAFLDHVKMIPSVEDGAPDTVYKAKEDSITHYGDYKIENKKDEPFVELYTYISNIDDKFSIHFAKTKKIHIPGKGMKWENEKYRAAFEKYLKVKKEGIKIKKEKDAEVEALKKQVAELQAKTKNKIKSKEKSSSAKSGLKTETKIDNDTSDNKPKYS
jgi:hypothetical protein